MTQAVNVAPMSPEEASSTPLKAEFLQHAVMTPAAATPERLARPHQLVTLKNTDERQTHFVVDRHYRHVGIRAGQTREIDMCSDELANLMRLARTDRGHYESGINKGKPYPAHPVRVVGLGQQIAPALV